MLAEFRLNGSTVMQKHVSLMPPLHSSVILPRDGDHHAEYIVSNIVYSYEDEHARAIVFLRDKNKDDIRAEEINADPRELFYAKMFVAELMRARAKWPIWHQDPIYAVATMMEEAGEVQKGINNWYLQQGDDKPIDIVMETIETGAMCLRFLLDTPVISDVNMAYVDKIMREKLNKVQLVGGK